MERIARLEQAVEQIVGVPFPQFMEDISERTSPQERISDRTLVADVPVPAILETFPQERISERTHEQIVDVPVPHVALQEHISERIHEHTVDQPGDQARRDPADLLHRQGCRGARGDATTGPPGFRLYRRRWQSPAMSSGLR